MSHVDEPLIRLHRNELLTAAALARPGLGKRQGAGVPLKLAGTPCAEDRTLGPVPCVAHSSAAAVAASD